MAVTATTVAAATTMLAAVAAVFLTLVLCFYIFLCAKRFHSGSPPPGSGVRAWLRAVFFLGNSAGTTNPDASTGEWCYEGGLDEKSMAKLPRREVGKGDDEDLLQDCCAVCITELAPGDTARVLPRCGHAFHVDCVDMWLRSHSTCPLCRCPAVDDPPVPPAVHAPEADPESPNFPTNVLFFGSQDDVSTGRSSSSSAAAAVAAQEHVAVAVDVVAENARACGLRRLIGCGGAATPTTQPPHRCDRRRRQEEEEDEAGGDIEMGLAGAGGESSASRPVKPAQAGS